MIIILDGIFALMRENRELTLSDAKFIHKFNELVKNISCAPTQHQSASVSHLSVVP